MSLAVTYRRTYRPTDRTWIVFGSGQRRKLIRLHCRHCTDSMQQKTRETDVGVSTVPLQAVRWPMHSTAGARWNNQYTAAGFRGAIHHRGAEGDGRVVVQPWAILAGARRLPDAAAWDRGFGPCVSHDLSFAGRPSLPTLHTHDHCMYAAAPRPTRRRMMMMLSICMRRPTTSTIR